jgi:cell division protein FtsL
MAAKIALMVFAVIVIIALAMIVTAWYADRESTRDLKREEMDHEERKALFEDEDL